MEAYLCDTCGTQFAPSERPPSFCPVCADERQYVGWSGQTWTTPAALARQHRLRLEPDAGLLGIDMVGRFAIGQRALWLPTRAGRILWECTSLVTPEAVQALREHGGVDLIAISHPHFYAAMVDWSDALGGVPIMLHEADRAWVQRPSPRIRHWSGDRLELGPGVTLLRSGGHFDGSTVLHWADGPRGGVLMCGDSPQVLADRRHFGFMRSYPNHLPLPPAEVRAMRERLAGLDFEDAYGYDRGRHVRGGARAALDASFERYLRAVADTAASSPA